MLILGMVLVIVAVVVLIVGLCKGFSDDISFGKGVLFALGGYFICWLLLSIGATMTIFS